LVPDVDIAPVRWTIPEDGTRLRRAGAERTAGPAVLPTDD